MKAKFPPCQRLKFRGRRDEMLNTQTNRSMLLPGRVKQRKETDRNDWGGGCYFNLDGQGRSDR